METWMILTPRQAELIECQTPRATDNGALLASIKTKLVRGALDVELTLSDHELNQVKAAARNWKGGHSEAFKGILNAAGVS
jgi:hypothetical protein